ncbi:MAG: PLP-dependent aminotransferase family protein [Anaerolineaceae bacterium]|nr:PLP-dependent aminotransferase family protein [Anaerolineaceae bacterium]
MRIVIDRTKSLPLFQQIGDQIRNLILSGMLEPGTRLPAIRRMAQDIGVNRITIETAYDDLKAEGLVDSKTGSGTYVLSPYPVEIIPKEPDIDRLNCGQGVIQPRKLINHSSDTPRQDVIMLGAGAGDIELFPVEEFRKVNNRVLKRDGILAMDYGPVSGYVPLKEMVFRILASQGQGCSPDQVLITAGSQQAILLTVLYLLKPGDTILVETPTYAGALDLFRGMGLNIIGIPIDHDGMQVELIENAIKKFSPKLIYTVPTFNNPTGTCMSGARRRKLAGLAEKYKVHVLEDDFVGDLRYEGRSQPPIKAFDVNSKWVIYVSTFSKMLMPGLRVGFLVIDKALLNPLINIKRVNDLATSNLNQRALAEYINIGRYRKFLRRSVSLYQHRKNVMLQAILTHLPSEIEVFHFSQGGLFLWLKLPVGLSAQKLFEKGLEYGVSIEVGNKYFPDTILSNPFVENQYFRINFAANSEYQIIRGIKRLKLALVELMG